MQELFFQNEEVVGLEDEEMLLSHPVVQASANVVIIDDTSVPNEFFGPLYISPDMVPLKVSYDTLSDWTVISSDNYNAQTSNSATPWTTVNDDPITQEVKFSKFQVKGPIYNETMCLSYQSQLNNPSKARLCVENMPFVSSSIVSQYENTYQGMLGLAKGQQN